MIIEIVKKKFAQQPVLCFKGNWFIIYQYWVKTYESLPYHCFEGWCDFVEYLVVDMQCRVHLV